MAVNSFHIWVISTLWIFYSHLSDYFVFGLRTLPIGVFQCHRAQFHFRSCCINIFHHKTLKNDQKMIIGHLSCSFNQSFPHSGINKHLLFSLVLHILKMSYFKFISMDLDFTCLFSVTSKQLKLKLKLCWHFKRLC